MHEAQQIAVDVADVERHRLLAAGQRDPAVLVGEHQQRPTAASVASLGLSSLDNTSTGRSGPSDR